MKDKIEKLIEDYQRKIKLAIKLRDAAYNSNQNEVYHRLVIKTGSYKTFISELENILKDA